MKNLQRAKKSLGQNFLIDNNIINKIIKIGNIDKNTNVMEIGSGYGNLTKAIIYNNPKKILAVEKDKKLAFLLNERFKHCSSLKVINRDILDIIAEKKSDKNIIVFGNLPYNISTKILSSLIMLKDWPPWYDALILMFQKEVADRILAKVKTKDFSRLTVLSNWRLEIKKHFDVSRHCFSPKPKINSTILSFKPKKNIFYNFKNPKNLEKITRILFSNRRKMINKNLIKLFKGKKSLINELAIDLNKRPEELNSEIFYRITMLYEKSFN